MKRSLSRSAKICTLMVLVSVLFGVRKERALAARSRPPRKSEACADCVVLDVDLHAHTRFSDGLLSPFELVLAAKRKGLDAVAVTEHNMLFPAQMAAWFSAIVDGPIVLEGQEVTTSAYHLIAVGLSERVTPSRDLRRVIDDVHRQGGVAIAAHPIARYWPAFDAVRDVLDAAEVVHPASLNESESFPWSEMVTFFERDRPLTAVGSSDFHFFDTLGVCRTEVHAEGRTRAAILDALRAGRTHVLAPDGRSFGAAPRGPSHEKSPRAYAPLDGLDLAARVMGWLGVVGLLLLRRRREPIADDRAI